MTVSFRRFAIVLLASLLMAVLLSALPSNNFAFAKIHVSTSSSSSSSYSADHPSDSDLISPSSGTVITIAIPDDDDEDRGYFYLTSSVARVCYIGYEPVDVYYVYRKRYYSKKTRQIVQNVNEASQDSDVYLCKTSSDCVNNHYCLEWDGQIYYAFELPNQRSGSVVYTTADGSASVEVFGSDPDKLAEYAEQDRIAAEEKAAKAEAAAQFAEEDAERNSHRFDNLLPMIVGIAIGVLVFVGLVFAGLKLVKKHGLNE